MCDEMNEFFFVCGKKMEILSSVVSVMFVETSPARSPSAIIPPLSRFPVPGQPPNSFRILQTPPSYSQLARKLPLMYPRWHV